VKRTLLLTSPHIRGKVVGDCQYLLTHGRFGNFHPGPIDDEYGETTAAATRRAKYALGYAKSGVNRKFGPALYAYLHGDKRLSSAMKLRRRQRLTSMAKKVTVKGKALDVALGEAHKHVVESPAGSNSNPYGRWFGFNRVPWCAIFVSYCMSKGGDRKGLRTALAYQFEYWARSHSHGLSLTASPEPGDIVVYHHGQGHVEIFRRWTNRAYGRFETVGGNTSASGSQDNGGAVLVRQRYLSWARTVFVRVGE
jgi:hypothetical protein